MIFKSLQPNSRARYGKRSGKSLSVRRPKLVSFDEESRKEFVTGFRARRLQRQAEGKTFLLKKAKAERLRTRNAAKQARNEYFEQLHPSLFKDHKLIDSFDDDQNEARAAEAIQEFSDDDHNIVVVKTSSNIILDRGLQEAIDECDVLETDKKPVRSELGANHFSGRQKGKKGQQKQIMKKK